jgi:16S rRNA (uracil1498-N3)-methyltransferase
MGRRWRLFHPELPRKAGSVIDLAPEEAHHARRVLRLAAGEAVAVFDGLGREWTGRLLRCEADLVRVSLERELLDPGADPTLAVSLFQAHCRPDRMEWVLQKGTEIGLAAVHPWPARRAEARGVSDSRLRRWERIVLEACKQSGRRRAPRIELREDLPEAAPGAVLAVALDPTPGMPPLRDYLAGEQPGAVWIAAGPEAGFEAAELERWAERGWRRAGLGPRTLRAENAGLVAAALVLHRWGDLG